MIRIFFSCKTLQKLVRMCSILFWCCSSPGYACACGHWTGHSTLLSHCYDAAIVFLAFVSCLYLRLIRNPRQICVSSNHIASNPNQISFRFSALKDVCALETLAFLHCSSLMLLCGGWLRTCEGCWCVKAQTDVSCQRRDGLGKNMFCLWD